jgi:hypothetical protein
MEEELKIINNKLDLLKNKLKYLERYVLLNEVLKKQCENEKTDRLLLNLNGYIKKSKI